MVSETYNLWSIIIQVVTLFVLFAAAIIYFFQMRAMQTQIEVARTASESQNILNVIMFLQQDEFRAARHAIINDLRETPYAAWQKNESHRKAASTVCSSYDVLGILIRRKSISPESILPHWGPSIIACYEQVKDYIAEMQKQSGPEYWDEFKWLADEAKKIFPSRQ